MVRPALGWHRLSRTRAKLRTCLGLDQSIEFPILHLVSRVRVDRYSLCALSTRIIENNRIYSLCVFQRNVWERPSREDWPGRRSISYRPIDFPEKLKRVVRALASFVCANLKRDRPFASFPAATSTTPSASTNGSR